MKRSRLAILLCSAVAACSQQSQGTMGPNGIPASDAPIDMDSAADTQKTLPDAPEADPNVLWREGDCAHPKVEQTCRDGWCAVPAGCFIIGSPEDEWGRGMYTEDFVPVTLTRSFHLQQYEFTYAQWTALGLMIPDLDHDGDCAEPTCPLGNINGMEAMLLANLVSERHTPPLPPCYRLEGCQRELGQGVQCESVAFTTPSIYECEGFRLPTEYEWEYAARAGTRTSNYNGGLASETTYEMAVNCRGERNLEPIAWFCANSGDRVHPVGEKLPNAWGFHDVLGNSEEWTNDHMKDRGYGSDPLTDPGGQLVPSPYRVVRGAPMIAWPTLLRAAYHFPADWRERGPGVRLARTGTENPGPLASASVAGKSKPGIPKGKR